MHSEFLGREIDMIEDEMLNFAVKRYLEEYTPDYFWEIGASSSGKYHPTLSQGEGGLVRHTKAVVWFAKELMALTPYNEMNQLHKDYTIAACILHDTCKYGTGSEIDKSKYKDHGEEAAKRFTEFCKLRFDRTPSDLLTNAIISHMGQWTLDKGKRPMTNIDKVVHLADYVASRQFVDIPEVTKDYAKVIEDGGYFPF